MIIIQDGMLFRNNMVKKLNNEEACKYIKNLKLFLLFVWIIITIGFHLVILMVDEGVLNITYNDKRIYLSMFLLYIPVPIMFYMIVIVFKRILRPSKKKSLGTGSF